MGKTGQTLFNVQMLRAVAAALVVLCHATFFWGPYLPNARTFAFVGGFSGVDLFFVISGFIISMVADRDSSRGRFMAVGNYIVSRVLRIFPIYWIVLAATLITSAILPGVITERQTVAWWRVVSLATTYNPVVVTAWTLCFEIYFYTLVAFALLVAGRAFKAFAIIGAVVYFACIVSANFGQQMEAIYVNPMVLDFLMGIGVFYATDRNWVKYPLAASTLGLLGLAFGTFVMMDEAWRHAFARPYLVGIPSAFLVAGMVELERQRIWRAPAWVASLGDASYSTYLWHVLLIRILIEFHPDMPPVIGSFLAVAVLVGFGWLSYKFLEEPISKASARLRRYLFSRRAGYLPATAISSA